ncbi:hypothetical protein D3C76_954450 [compost metagenome]
MGQNPHRPGHAADPAGITDLQCSRYLERQRPGYRHDGTQDWSDRDGSGDHGGDGANPASRL